MQILSMRFGGRKNGAVFSGGGSRICISNSAITSNCLQLRFIWFMQTSIEHQLNGTFNVDSCDKRRAAKSAEPSHK